MKIDIVSIFPDYLAPLRLSLVGKAIETGIVELGVHDLRHWTSDRHRTVDDTPYGGGAGMVMKPEPWGAALDAVLRQAQHSGESRPELVEGPVLRQAQHTETRQAQLTDTHAEARLIVLTPSGRPFSQRVAHELAAEEHLIFACGRYEGIDARVAEDAGTRMRVDEISIGDYVLNGGEAAALVIIEAVVRLIPGVIGNPASLAEESHSLDHEGLLEYPVYTKPPSWRGLDVPEVLFSGHHGRIAGWRREQALARTRERRPELIPERLGELIITEATSAEAGELWTLQRAAYLTEGVRYDTFDIPPLVESFAELEASLANGVVLLARQNGRLVGSVRGERHDGDVWYVGRLMVAPDRTGEGIARILMDLIEARAPEGVARFRLFTGAESERNVRFYRRRGYRVVRRETLSSGPPILIMERPLS